MSLKHVQRTYEWYGNADPLYAVLSDKGKKGHRWDVGEFFEAGRQEIGRALTYLDRLGVDLKRGAALDFGCGVGRLTQALCEHFDEAVGVDISSSMIRHARSYNRFGDRCSYHLNTTADLALFDDASFDFIYTNIVLQHIPAAASAKYIAEFFRVLRPGGIAMFQIPSGRRHKPGSLGEKLSQVARGPLRRLWKRVRGKPTVEMHQIHRSRVEEIIAESGGRLIDVRQFGSVRITRVSYMYCAVRE